MHPVTAAVRDLYERFPYPAGPVTLRTGFDVRRSLSFVDAERPDHRTPVVLDAGCGRGLGLLGMATAQPGLQFVGIDLNRTALAEATQAARQRGLTNVRFAEVDLETLEGLEVPDGGFDVIISSGVLPHLVDPVAGLRRLRSALAPWGVVDLMVYAKAGRVGIERVAAEIAQQIPDGPVERRLAQARAFVASNPFDPAHAEAARLEDVEFVDRYLHPQFVSYTLPELHALVHRAGTSALRWTDAAAWGPPEHHHPATDDVWELARTHEARVQPRMYDLLLTHAGVKHRPLPAELACDAAGWALNGEGQLQRGTRTLWSGQRQTGLWWQHSNRPPLPLQQGAAGIAAPFLAEIDRPFRGFELLDHLARHGIDKAIGRKLLRALAAVDLLWCPHETDLHHHRAVPQAA